MAQRLNSLIGHDDMVAYARRVCAHEKPAHAYGIIGRSGVGSGAFARWFAGALAGYGDSDSRLIPSVQPGLVREFSPDTDDGRWRREEVEHVVHELSLRGWNGSGVGVVIIYRCDLMTDECANTLLKCLEEPRERVVILCQAHTEEKVVSTVRSRLVLLRLGLVAPRDMETAAHELAISSYEIPQMAVFAAGRPGLLVRMAHDASYAMHVRTLHDMCTRIMRDDTLSPELVSSWRSAWDTPDALDHVAHEVLRGERGSRMLASRVLLYERMHAQHVPTRHLFNFLIS